MSRSTIFSEYVRQIPVEENGKHYRCTINGAIVPYEYNTILFKPDKENVSALAVHCFDIKGKSKAFDDKKVINLTEKSIGEVFTISIVDHEYNQPKWSALNFTGEMIYLGMYKALGTLAISKDHLGTETIIHFFKIAT